MDLDLRAQRRTSPPSRLGEYQILRTLGTGGMATVYLAKHFRSGQQFALKVIAPHLTHHPQVVARFVAEAKTVSRIHHPNVIQIFDHGQLSDGTLFQVMELLDGYELTRLMAQQPQMSAWQVEPFVHQICMGLQAAHDQGVIHRDLKPNNVFVLHGEALALKLLDFGIAKLLDPGEGGRLTVTGTVLGTPLYMAPEQVMGREEIGPQTDLYSLGVMIYSMLCGKPPFDNDAVGVLMLRHLEDLPPPLRERSFDVPEAVARLVHRCLEKSPARRPASARQLAADFTRAVNEAEAAPTVCWRESRRQHDTLVDRDDTLTEGAGDCPASHQSRVGRENATEPDASLPGANHDEPAVDEPSDAISADPPAPPLLEPRRTGPIARHVWFPLGVMAAILALLILAVFLFVWLAWGDPFR